MQDGRWRFSTRAGRNVGVARAAGRAGDCGKVDRRREESPGDGEMIERPTGIIRTLPSLYGDASVGAKKYQRSIACLEAGSIPAIYIALQSIPKVDVLHMYLLIEGKITLRM